MRIDAHQHFWDYDPERYGWITEDMQVLATDYGPEELKPHLDEHGLDGSVVVQARQDLDETRWMLGLTEKFGFLKGVVGWVDLRSPELGGQLDELCAHDKLVGVRHVVQDEPDERFLLREDFCAGVAQLAARGLVYDVLIYPQQLPAALEFTARFPEQPMVLDHIAKPTIGRGELEPWTTQMRELGTRANLTCKVSGMITEARWNDWRPQDFHPYLDVVLEAFGPERLMFGSDWPVCRLSGEYGPMQAIVADYFADLTDDEKSALWGGTAVRAYGLKD
ncbi:MAG: amidohydrolase family protein [Planctomycetota bacterium]|nr:amidohydrolase family protein [Planctomycetota bacterium]